MGVGTQVPLAEYLSTVYEPDREYVDGELVERALPDNSHSKAQASLAGLLFPLSRTGKLHVRTELRVKIEDQRYRIPDVSAYLTEPQSRYPDYPPLLKIEIVSPEDRYSDIVRKLDEYRRFGVGYVWLVDPQSRQLLVYDSSGLRGVPALRLPEFDFEIKPADIF